MTTKKEVFQGYLGNEEPVSREFAAEWIRSSRWFGCTCERIRIRSSHGIRISDGATTTQFILRHRKS